MTLITMIKRAKITNKQRFDFDQVAIDRINRCKCKPSGIVTFPELFMMLGRSFQLKKQDVWSLLFHLQKKGKIKIIRFKGVVTT